MKDLLNEHSSTNKIRKILLILSIIAYVIFVMEFFISYISYPCYTNNNNLWLYTNHDSLIPIQLLFKYDHSVYGQGTYILELKVGIFALMVALLIVATKYLTNIVTKGKTDERELVVKTHKLLSLAFWFTGLYYLSALVLTEFFVLVKYKFYYDLIMNGSILPFIIAIILKVVFNIYLKKIKKLTGNDYLIYKKRWRLRIAFIIIATLILEIFFIVASKPFVMFLLFVACVIGVISLLKQQDAFYLNEQKRADENKANQARRLVEHKEYLWEANLLKKKNERCLVREKLSLSKLSDKMHKQINNSGISISEDEVKNLLTAMACCRGILLNVKNYDLARKFSEVLNECFSTELFTENYIEIKKDKSREEELTADEIKLNKKYGVESGVYVAQYLNNFITTVFFDEHADTSSMKVRKFFEAVGKAKEYVYLGKLDYLEENEEFNNGRMLIPDNLWVIGFINNDNLSKILQEDWTNYATIVDLDISKKEVEENEECIQITYPNFVQEVEEIQETYYLSEVNWKKFDKLDEYLVKVLGYGFENRFIRQIEKFVSAYLSMGGTQEKAIDEVLSMKILPWLAEKKEILVSETVGDFALVVSEIFGVDAIPKAKESLIRFELKR